MTSEYSVELPGIEPLPDQAIGSSELQVHSISFRFSPARYLRVRSRVLTASRVTPKGAKFTGSLVIDGAFQPR